MRSIAVAALFSSHAARLGLTWIAGRGGGARECCAEGPPTAVPAGSAEARVVPRSLVGHLNLIHPNQVQVFGLAELSYLTTLGEHARRDAIRQLLAQAPGCVVVADGQPPPAELVQGCDGANTPLFSSSLPSDKLVADLNYYLANLLAATVTVHGVYMEVTAIGVLITGPPGVGKSELALELITRGHRLVADDTPQFSRIAPDIVNGTCPRELTDFLEVRGIGVINVRQLFGDSAVKANKYLRLIVHLDPLGPKHQDETKRLEGTYRTRNILDVQIPEISLPVAPGRNLAVLVECAARNHILRMSGYDSSADFISRQARLIAQGRQ
ncbi:MAG: HPr(Ser) kinase/phosphatase [Gammaproteobacteria bacterium]|nr:HPr(Ser) kinase/phosphatase [Gammaproteobacteria bacterium]